MAYLHNTLAEGGWQKLTLLEQMGNIGSEVSRAIRSRGKDEALYEGAVTRAFELFDLTLADPRWKGRLHEIARARETFADAVLGGKEYKSTLEDILRYCDVFAMAARR